MEPTNFDESNKFLDKPQDMSYDDCSVLNVWQGLTIDSEQPCTVSCWKVTQEELEEINKTGRVWLMVFGGGMPPVMVCGLKPLVNLDPGRN